MDADRLLEGLDPSQRHAVTTPTQPLAILAGAGSGKTRVLTRRIAHRCLTGDADARHVLALTFTRKAATELDTRLRAFGLRDLPAAGTFHAVAYAQLRTRWAAAQTAPPVLLDRKGRFMRRILGGTTRVSASDLAMEIEWAKARLVTPDAYPTAAAQADRRLPVDPERIAEWYRRYEEDKRRRGVVDFDDLLAHLALAVETDPSFAAAQRWRFRHLFVDEYQDLNPLQARTLQAWLGDRTDLAVVGDPNQAIYGWNGADPTYLRRFAEHHPGAEVVELTNSYRSTPQVLATAASVLAGGRPDARRPLIARRGNGPLPTITGYATDLDEANGIARAVHDEHGPGRSWSSQAVLVRTNAQASIIETVFRRGAIPFRVRGSGHLLEEPAVIELLRSFDRRNEPLATTIADLDASISTERALLDREPIDDDPRIVRADGPVDTASSTGRRIAALEQLVRLGRDLLVVEPTARADGFSGWLRANLRDDDSDRRDAVTIVSFHAAKGLEWPVVHLAGLEAGIVPISHARNEAQKAEEQRLLYVAITRAADVLRCTWAAKRTFGSKTYDRKPSPYLDWVRAAIAELAQANADADDPETAIASSRAALDPRGAAQPAAQRSPNDGHELRNALQNWRREQARQADVRPTVVLTDKALEALVRSRPTTDDDLAAMADVGPFIRERHGARLLAIVAEQGARDGATADHHHGETPCASN